MTYRPPDDEPPGTDLPLDPPAGCQQDPAALAQPVRRWFGPQTWPEARAAGWNTFEWAVVDALRAALNRE